MANNILRFWKAQDSDDPFEPLFNAAPVLMHSIDRTGVLVRVSRFWADKLGYEVDEMIDRKSVEFLTPESREYASKVVLLEFFRIGRIYNVEYDFVRKGGEVLPVLMSAIGEYDEDGEYVRSLAIMFDNTESKRAAIELRQKHRLEATGALAGGVAHDFNNLLSVIQGNLEFLQKDPDDADRGEFVASALAASRRGAELVQQLLSFGRKAHMSPSLIDLNEAVRRVDRLVRRLLPANVAIETVFGAGLWKSNLDSALLETALLNILNDARDALPTGGRITIETANVRINGDYVQARGEEIEPGRYVMVAISDTGVGMDKETVAQVFEPFFTTKPVGQGSGLGLSMVFGFVRQSDGTVRAYSEKGVGTTIRMYFPAVLAEEARPEPEVHDTGGGRVILLAEDELSVRQVFVRQLKDKDHKVVACASGDEALRQIEEGLRPEVLLTDIVMTGSMQGPELAARARELVPGIRVIFITGYPAEAAIHGNGVQPHDLHLIKPVSQSALFRAVRDMLKDDE